MACHKLITLSIFAVVMAPPSVAADRPNHEDEPKPMARITLSSAASETSPALDLGEVIRGDEVPITFELENDAEEAITLTALRSGCACTTIDSWPPLIEAGERGVVTGRFAAPSRAGTRRESEVGLYDGGTRLGAVTVAAEIVDPIRVEVVVTDDSVVITLAARDQKQFALSGIEPSALTNQIDTKKQVQTHRLRLDRASLREAGSPRHLVFATTHPRQRHVVAELVYSADSSSARPSHVPARHEMRRTPHAQ